MQELQLPVQNWLKFLSTQAGRDKVYRFVQYFSRFLSYNLSHHEKGAEVAKRLSNLSAAVGLGRKLFRMGKPLDFLQTILKSLATEDEILRLAVIVKCTGYGCWLVLDMLQWLQAVGVIKLGKDTMSRINGQAPRLWLLGIAASLVANLQKMQKNFVQRQVESKLTAQGAPSPPSSLLDREMRKLTKDAVQDLIDISIPMSIVGLIKLSPGTVGLAGSITSLMGAATIYPSN